MTIDLKYETIGKRVVAFLIDNLLLLLPSVMIMRNAFDFQDPFRYIPLYNASGVLLTIIGVLYYVIAHYKYGQTIGKKITNIKVIDLSESHGITIKQAVLRSLVPIIFAVLGLITYFMIFFDLSDLMNHPVVYPILYMEDHIGIFWMLAEFITMMVTIKRRAIHDFIAGTVVVDYKDDEKNIQA
jgi:uncharacterized RDD family membrane protein YckC